MAGALIAPSLTLILWIHLSGHLYGGGIVDDEGDTEMLVGDGTKVKPAKSTFFIPQIALHEDDGRERKRVLV